MSLFSEMYSNMIVDDIKPPIATKLTTLSRMPFSGDQNVADVHEKLNSEMEVGSHAVWSVSTCKVGFGVDHLRDKNTDSYWQSDGTQPHYVTLKFNELTPLSYLCIYTDSKLDESYTPQKITLFHGINPRHVVEFMQLEMTEPVGWVVIPLHHPRRQEALTTFVLQIKITQNHQNGKDSHFRQIKVFSPRRSEDLFVSI